MKVESYGFDQIGFPARISPMITNAFNELSWSPKDNYNKSPLFNDSLTLLNESIACKICMIIPTRISQSDYPFIK